MTPLPLSPSDTETDEHVLRATLDTIAPADSEVGTEAKTILDGKVKPVGSLGRLEGIAVRMAAIRGRLDIGEPSPAVVVCAADHGVVAEGVSAYPAEVTGLMLDAFSSGGAAVCVLSRQVGARLVVADLGVATPPPARPDGLPVLDLRVRPGTASSAAGPAMTRAEALTALRHGIDLAARLVDEGADLIGLGEMGIGNTTTASALTAALLGIPPADVVGPGTGLTPEQVAHKVSVVEKVLTRHTDVVAEPRDPVAVLAALGGLEVAALAGVVLGCAARRVPVVVDGFITGSAALVAAALAPVSVESMIAGHRSPEPGHAVQLRALGLEPVVDLGMRLGEGSGAAVAIGVIRSALAIYAEMASFESLGIGGQPEE